jgi:hypothetical protein
VRCFVLIAPNGVGQGPSISIKLPTLIRNTGASMLLPSGCLHMCDTLQLSLQHILHLGLGVNYGPQTHPPQSVQGSPLKFHCFLYVKKSFLKPGAGGSACNPSYSGGRVQEDHGLKPTLGK